MPPHNFFDGTGVLARSGDGKKVIFGNDFLPGNVILYDSASDSFIEADVPGYPFSVAANADGTQFAVAVDTLTSNSGIYVFDAQLNLITILPAMTPVRYSADGTKLYAVGFLGNVPVVQIFDMQNYSAVGMAPSYASSTPYFEQHPFQEKPLVADETGRLFGSADHGLAIDDTTDLHPYTGNEIFRSTTSSSIQRKGRLTKGRVFRWKRRIIRLLPEYGLAEFPHSIHL